ncbi:MAG TPA: TonB-dependent receptor [Steroidobacteraceae bacterium]|jgi:iron complex outermembrane receptor protein|nr:TonB-dependent receptor [Steroidobacteraceae bacterium]
MSHRREKRARQLVRARSATRLTALSAGALLGLVPWSAGAATPAAADATGPADQTSSNTPAGSDQLQEVVITGYRASVQSALDEKRKAIQPIEVVNEEDIGKMPDQNVAESLERLPGVSINRDGGKGTQVLIDGLANNLITLNGEVLLAGREMYSSGEASGGAANIQYSSLEGIPSEEIGGIDVIKNPTAQDREGGLGGIIDLKTRSPLAQDMGLNLGGNVRGTKAEGQDGGPTAVATMFGGFKFSDDFAITASASYDDEKTHTKEFQDQNRNQWLVTNTATPGSYVGSPIASTNTTLSNGQTYIDPQLAYFSDIGDEIKTKGATLGAEWRWTDSITSTFNYFYIGEDEVSITYSNKAWFSGGSGETNAPGAPASFPGIDPTQPYSIDSNGVIQSATMMANGAETATLYEQNDTTAHNLQFNTTFAGNDKWHGDAGVFFAKASGNYEADQADVEHGAYAQFGSPNPSIQPGAPGCNNGANSCTNGNHGYAFIYSNGGTSGLPTVSYPNNYGYTNVLSNPLYTLFKSNWAWANKIDEKNWALKGDLHYHPGSNLDLTGGVRYEQREVDYVHGRYLEDGVDPYGINGVGAGTPAGNCCTAAGSGTWLYYQDPGYAAIPYSTPQTNPNLLQIVNNFASGPIAVKNPYTGGMTNPATYLNTVWAEAGIKNNTEAFFVDPLNSYDVTNKTTTAFIMGDAGDEVYHANFGVRVVHNQLTVDGGETNPNGSTYVGTASWNGVDANDVPFQNSRSYTDVLPTFNFVLNLTDTQKFRLGAARVLSPQNLNDIGRGETYDFTRAAPSECPGGGVCFKFDGGNSGNANLDPFRASQFFVSWEDYFARSGLIAVTGFYKQVDNFVTTANVATLVPDGTTAGGSTANVQTLVNGGSGKIYGAELVGQYAFDNGFGLQANYTRSNSDTTQITSFQSNLPIPGVPKNAFNVVGYYEHLGFSARLAYAWRDVALNDSLVGSFFTFQDINGNPKTYAIWSAKYGQLDGQLEYDIGAHFGVIFQVVNLTDEKQHTYLQWPNEPFTYDDSGRRFFFGFKGKL